jgi:hypothetical protein
MAFMDFCCGFQVSSFERDIHSPPAGIPLTASTTHLYLKVQAIIPPFMSKSTTAHPKGRSLVIPQIEKLLTEQTSVILQAVDEKLSTQNRRIDAVEKKVDKVINQLDAVLKKSEDHREEDVSGAEQLRRHDDQLQDHAVRIKKLETIRHP